MRAPAQTTPALAAYGRIAVAAAALALAIWLSLGAGQPRSAAAAAPARPNVIVILTDDQTVSQLSAEAMPKTLARLGDRGTSFSSSIVSSPLCCPSRAGFLTGDYPHNSGVFDNEPGYGALIDKSSIVYSWLQAAGYRTGHIGRYLLNYDRETPLGGDSQTDGGYAAPPGLDDWFGFVGPSTYYYGATFSNNGTPVVQGQEQARLHDPGDEPPRARLHPRRPDRPAALLPDARPRRAARRRDDRPRRSAGSAGCRSPTAASLASGATRRCRSRPRSTRRTSPTSRTGSRPGLTSAIPSATT